MRLFMMPLEKIKVMTCKINSGDDNLAPLCPSVKTHGEFCEVLGNKHYMEKWQTGIHSENMSCVICVMLITNGNIQAGVKKT